MKGGEVDLEELSFNPTTMIKGGWQLIRAGNEQTGYHARYSV